MESSRFDEMKEENLSLNNTMINVLTSIAKWTKFFAILGFICCGLLIIVGVFYTTILGNISSILPQQAGMNNAMASSITGGMGVVVAVIYILLSLLYFFPAYYLLKFSSNMKTALLNYDNSTLEKAFSYLKSHYKFIGVVTIVVLSFYSFMLLIMGIIAISAA